MFKVLIALILTFGLATIITAAAISVWNQQQDLLSLITSLGCRNPNDNKSCFSVKASSVRGVNTRLYEGFTLMFLLLKRLVYSFIN